MNKQKYRNFLITSILTAIIIIVVSTVMYVKDRLPNTIFINTNTSTKYNFSMPVSLNVENKTSIRLNGKNTIYSGEKGEYSGKYKMFGIVPIKNTKVKVVGLTKKFGDLLVLNDISFNVKKGDFVCIVGPTGCGKTTFLNLLVKLIEPTSGQILIDGEPADPKKHNIAFVFQEPSAYPWLTVEENLQYGLKIKKVDQKTIEERTKEIAESLGLTEVLKSYPRELSASLEQRVVIGRSFALHPDLLLMDEPYAQMDIKVRYYLEDQVIKLWQKTGSTVLFITHNIEEAVYLSEKCLILSQKPTTIKEEKIIDLPRPRDIASPEFIELREYVTKQIKWW